MQLMNIEECGSIMIFADCEPHEIILRHLLSWARSIGAIRCSFFFCPTPTVPGFLFSETNNKLITYEL